MEQILSNLCSLFLITSPGTNVGACNAALKATYVQTGTEQTYHLAEKYYERKLASAVHKNIIMVGAGVSAGIDAYKRQQIRVSTPLKPLCDNFSFDLTPGNQIYNLNWNFQW